MTIEVPHLLQLIFFVLQLLLFPILGDLGPPVASRAPKLALDCFKLREKLPHDFFASFAFDLQASIPKGVLIHKFEYNLGYDSPEFRFSLYGTATDSKSIFEFIKNLGQSRFFRSPSLRSTEEVPLKNDDYFILFQIEGQIDKPK